MKMGTMSSSQKNLRTIHATQNNLVIRKQLIPVYIRTRRSVFFLITYVFANEFSLLTLFFCVKLQKIARNKVCPCGSKKKYKACCGSVSGKSSKFAMYASL